jgi:hypothetical protein
MATSSFREDYLGRDLVAPTVNSLDALGRATASTVDFMGRPLRRIVRANTTAVTLNQEIQFLTGGQKFIVTVAGWATQRHAVCGSDPTDGGARGRRASTSGSTCPAGV